MRATRKLRGALAGGVFAANVRRRGRHERVPAVALPMPSLLAICAVAALAATPAASHAQEAQVPFDIAAQPLASALGVFGQQARQQVLFDEADMAGRNARAVKGLLTPRQALEQLLQGTGVGISRAGAGGFALKAVPPTPPSGEGASLAEVTVRAQAERADGLPPAYAGGQVARGGSVGILGNRDYMSHPGRSYSRLWNRCG
ncbi:MAG: Ferripyoverdine receptor [Xylophilus sp.]|nr:MAG: Ferripyoverdine receptor [Xylophilus sp.]